MRTPFIGAGLVMLAMVGCSAEATPTEIEVPDESVSGGAVPPVLTVDVGEGRTVTFYDLGDGTYALGETGPFGTARRLEGIDLGERSLVSIYEELRPGEPVPALLEAVTEYAGTPSTFTEPEPVDFGPGLEAPAPDVSTTQQAVTWDDFVRGRACNCSILGGSIDLRFCYGNRWGDFLMERKVDVAHFTVAHQSGDGLLANGYISNRLRISQWVAPGYWHNFVLWGPTDDLGNRLARTMRYHVTQGLTDVFHVSGCFIFD